MTGLEKVKKRWMDDILMTATKHGSVLRNYRRNPAINIAGSDKQQSGKRVLLTCLIRRKGRFVVWHCADQPTY
jgi:hypothetical protein